MKTFEKNIEKYLDPFIFFAAGVTFGHGGGPTAFLTSRTFSIAGAGLGYQSSQ
jgi:hypothetical protein